MSPSKTATSAESENRDENTMEELFVTYKRMFKKTNKNDTANFCVDGSFTILTYLKAYAPFVKLPSP